MESYVFAVVGIIVATGIFYSGYRQTIGAKKTRIERANDTVENILVRRIILEHFNASSAEIHHLLEGKARDFRVRLSDMYSEAQVLTNIFTRIVESDFIPQAQRLELVSRLQPLMEKAQVSPVTDDEVDDLPSAMHRFFTERMGPVVLALFAALIGGLIAVAPQLASINLAQVGLLPLLSSVALISLAMTGAGYLFHKVRESQEETTYSSRSKLVQDYLHFENQVVDLIKKCGTKIRPAAVGEEHYDFEINVGGKKVLLGIKPMPRRMPTSIVGRMMQVLSSAVERVGADEGFVITKDPVALPKVSMIGKSVSILSFNEFRRFLLDSSSEFLIPGPTPAPARQSGSTEAVQRVFSGAEQQRPKAMENRPVSAAQSRGVNAADESPSGGDSRVKVPSGSSALGENQ